MKGSGEAQECIFGYRSVSVQPVNEPATQLSPQRLGPISGLGTMEHRNLRRGLCSEEGSECVLCGNCPHAASLFIYSFIQRPQHAGHCSVSGATKINKERSLPLRLS